MGSNTVSTNCGKNRKAKLQTGTSRGQTLTNITVKIKPSFSPRVTTWTRLICDDEEKLEWTNFLKWTVCPL